MSRAFAGFFYGLAPRFLVFRQGSFVWAVMIKGGRGLEKAVTDDEGILQAHIGSIAAWY